MTGRYKDPRNKILGSLGLHLEVKKYGTASLILHVVIFLSIQEI